MKLLFYIGFVIATLQVFAADKTSASIQSNESNNVIEKIKDELGFKRARLAQVHC